MLETDTGLDGLVPEPPPAQNREDQGAGGGFPQAQTSPLHIAEHSENGHLNSVHLNI